MDDGERARQVEPSESIHKTKYIRFALCWSSTHISGAYRIVRTSTNTFSWGWTRRNNQWSGAIGQQLMNGHYHQMSAKNKNFCLAHTRPENLAICLHNSLFTWAFRCSPFINKRLQQFVVTEITKQTPARKITIERAQFCGLLAGLAWTWTLLTQPTIRWWFSALAFINCSNERRGINSFINWRRRLIFRGGHDDVERERAGRRSHKEQAAGKLKPTEPNADDDRWYRTERERETNRCIYKFAEARILVERVVSSSSSSKNTSDSECALRFAFRVVVTRTNLF